MTCALYRATANEIERLRADPSALDELLDPGSASAPRVRQVQPGGLLGLILRILPVSVTEVVPESEEAPRPLPARHSDHVVDIEKGWHGLHFLFTGTAFEGDEPACFLVRGGEDIGDEGHVRMLTVEQTQRFSEFLATHTREQLAGRYNPRRMTELEIYPDAIWLRAAPPEDSPLEWLLECFTNVQRFVAGAAAAGERVVIYLG